MEPAPLPRDESVNPRMPHSPGAVSTHVLVPEQLVARLRALARRSRVAQSEYLREAVDDLLAKYGGELTLSKR